MEKDGGKKEITFRKILLNKCQKEFEKEKSVEKRIHEKLEELTSKGLSVSEIWQPFKLVPGYNPLSERFDQVLCLSI